MRHVDVVTLFPQLFGPFLGEGLLKRAQDSQAVVIATVDLREYGLGKHRTVDDVPYGGGPGMVLRPEPVFAAVRAREAWHRERGRGIRRILLTPQGRPFDQAMARELAGRDETQLFICGRYEGFDERIRTGLVDEEISGGDFVCLGGEVIAMAVIEAMVRLLPGVLGNPRSIDQESFTGERLEYPQYTRPAEFEGQTVPAVLLSGHHGEIERWRREQALARTRERRPELIGKCRETRNRTGEP